jgi:hypothetical protein
MAPPDKGGLALILGGKPKPGPEMPGAEPEAEPDMLSGIASDLIAAVKAGDATGVAEALRAAHEECSAGYTDEAEV